MKQGQIKYSNKIKVYIIKTSRSLFYLIKNVRKMKNRNFYLLKYI